jgi:diguanylate cyclase (GGDEF)-like protein
LERLNHQALADQLELEKMAMFDGLTGLPNRSMLMFQLDKHIAGLKRSPRAVALMLLDLDDFKRINDSHGYGVGDSLLKAVAKRLRMQLRETDIAARFGGDEFAILLTDIEHMEDANVVATKLVEAFGQPFDIREHSFFVTVSVGIAIAGDHDISGTELLRHADIAMYEAKASKDSSYRTYDAAMNLKIMRRVELEAEAREAFQEDQFFLALQPKINIQTRRLVGFESLIRWNHPTKGPISPAEFIPVLEKTALMGKLDYWVIARSLSILSELTLNGFSEIGIAVNISAQQFLDSNLVEYLRQQLRHHNIDAHRVELELTETALVDDLSRACEVMNQVRDLGCKIAIDDFGTGYSSLTYLKAMPADVVKIDRSFVSGMLDDQGDRNIVHSTISMVRGMGITVVAEGIESTQQYQLLEDFNCHVGQGYLIARPIGQEELWETLKKSCVEGVWQLPLPQ